MNDTGLLNLLLFGSLCACLPALLKQSLLTYGLLITGLFFIYFTDQISFLVLLSLSFSTYYLAKPAQKHQICLISGILLIVCTYGYFIGTASGDSETIGNASLPLGLAFYCLRLIHYLLEHYKSTQRQHKFSEYLAYLFFPATILAGPVNRFEDFLRDLKRHRWEPELFNAGLRRILYGLVKIIVLGNTLMELKLGPVLLPYLESPTFAAMYLSALFMWCKLYVLFSGYSDIGIGFGALAGFRIPENFNSPFLATNIVDFWQRWHISLADWCRDYVYAPVLANWRNPLIATTASMVVLGLWHEFSVRYVLWGLYHGVGIATYRYFESHPKSILPAEKWFQPIQIWAFRLITINFVVLSYPITKAISLLFNF